MRGGFALQIARSGEQEPIESKERARPVQGAVVPPRDTWWAHQDSNLEPKDYESSALTIEL